MEREMFILAFGGGCQSHGTNCNVGESGGGGGGSKWSKRNVVCERPLIRLILLVGKACRCREVLKFLGKFLQLFLKGQQNSLIFTFIVKRHLVTVILKTN